jgi:alpha-L-glutamate ligase-like protein
VTRSRQWIVLSLTLLMLGGLLMAYKVVRLGFPLLPDERSEQWVVQTRLEIEPLEGPVRASLLLPARSSGFIVSAENFISRGFGLTLDEELFRREAHWAIRRLYDPKTLYYRATVIPDTRERRIDHAPDFPAPPVLEEPWAGALNDLVAEVRAESADIESFAAEVLDRLGSASPDENVRLFLADADTPLERARLAQTLLAGARIPTMLVHGITLQRDVQRAVLKTLLAVYNGDDWLLFDPQDGHRGRPANFMIWYRGEEELATITGAHLADLQISVKRRVVSSVDLATQRAELKDSLAGRITLLGLPVQTQSVYEVLLLVPFGILAIVILRNFIGLSSFGTFAPVLIALAFRETELLKGILLFVLIVSLGLVFRFYMERLRLLLVPRLAAVVTIVVLLMTAISIISDQIGAETGLSVSLFPMVIISMVIERMSIVWEERGAGDAIREGIGSLAIAALAYLIMSIDGSRPDRAGPDRRAGPLHRFPPVRACPLPAAGQARGAAVMFGNLSAMRRAGVLGLNCRNSEYTLKYNPRRFYPLVDDKVLCKQRLQQRGLAVPALIALVEFNSQSSHLGELLGDHTEFVIKPAHGSGGSGILVIADRKADYFVDSDGKLVLPDDLAHHLTNVIGGLYSLGGQPDVAMIESLVHFDPLFAGLTYHGVPDIRLIVYRGYPVMAMTRLPTRMSHGKANLHQGAIGAGIDLGSGVTFGGVSGNHLVSTHPDTGHPIAGFQVPHWSRIVSMAAQCYEAVELGYLGVDIVLDRDLGPLILELNARPGLNIQLANRCGLRSRLDVVDALGSPDEEPECRVEWSRRRFGQPPVDRRGQQTG